MTLSAAPNPVAAQPTSPRRHVALCEPDPSLSVLFSEWLSQAGFDPVAGASGHAGDVVLVVADLRTPRRDGAERVAALRVRAPGARVLAISGHFIASGAADAARALGADAALAKPFSRATFIEAVRALL